MTVALAFLLFSACANAQEQHAIAFWNVENYFDTEHDTLKDDHDFTPAGNYHWTPSRYLDKRDKIYKTVVAMHYPTIFGLAEVENDGTLRSLCKGTPLRNYGYDFIHYESPDRRGIDCALLYRRDLFHVIESHPISVSDTSKGFYTRDILLVGGVLEGNDTCYFLVNHWPSKKGGTQSNRRRMAIAKTLRTLLDSLQSVHPQALIMAMGDLNTAPDERVVRRGLAFDKEGRNPEGFYNLMYQIPKGEGSYKYQDQWSCLDQMIANRQLKVEIFCSSFLLVPDTRYLGDKPFRSYAGIRYQGGYSDHLPIIAHLP